MDIGGRGINDSVNEGVNDQYFKRYFLKVVVVNHLSKVVYTEYQRK